MWYTQEQEGLGFCREVPSCRCKRILQGLITSKREQQESGMKVPPWASPASSPFTLGEKLALPGAAAPPLSSVSREKQMDGHQQIIIDFPHDGSWFTKYVLSPYRKEVSELLLLSVVQNSGCGKLNDKYVCIAREQSITEITDYSKSCITDLINSNTASNSICKKSTWKI